LDEKKKAEIARQNTKEDLKNHKKTITIKDSKENTNNSEKSEENTTKFVDALYLVLVVIITAAFMVLLAVGLRNLIPGRFLGFGFTRANARINKSNNEHSSNLTTTELAMAKKD